jgi:hypothetical protein
MLDKTVRRQLILRHPNDLGNAVESWSKWQPVSPGSHTVELHPTLVLKLEIRCLQRSCMFNR